jgi:hypothetical protein
MSQETQDFTQKLGDKFNSMMDNPTLFSVEATNAQNNEDIKNKLITSITNVRSNLTDSYKNFKEYYIQTYGNEKWVEFNKNPNFFGIPTYLFTGISNDSTKNPTIPQNLGFLSLQEKNDYHTPPTFYKKIYDTYLKNAMISANYYTHLIDKSPLSKPPDNMDEIYKILNIDLEKQIQDKTNTTNVNERKTFYETQETNKMFIIVNALRKWYIRIFIVVIFIKLYVYFLTQPISIQSILKELLYIGFLFIIPFIIAFIIRILIIVPKKIYEYLPANIWIANMKNQ